ncbi:MAG: T9SS type A sorting domain-containing protein, partial [Flavobacterium sp.]|nr:T9SS type A sorting domain-containing protein [Flavobacterium sp.]
MYTYTYQSIAIQTDGKIIAVGYLPSTTSTTDYENFGVLRLNTNGAIDTTYGTNGFVNSVLFSETGGSNMIKIQSDDKIIVTGNYTSSTGASTTNTDFSTARYNINGTLDTTFGVNGYAITDFGSINGETSRTVEIQNDGKILVAGSAHYPNYDLAIVRYLSNSLLDTSFATNGKFTYNFGTTTIPFSNGLSSDEVSAIKINSLGKIILGATTNVNESSNNNSNFGFICLNSNGTLDTSFGNNGQKVVDFGGASYLDNLKITTDDKIIATGEHDYTVGTNQLTNIPLVKLLANGNFDTSFGNNGIVLTNRDATNTFDIVHDLSIQADGKIICFGATPNSTNTSADFLLIRFNIDGTIDSTFNTIGYKTVSFNSSSAVGYSFLIQNDGKIVCSGAINLTSSASGVGCLARLEIDNLSTNSFEKNKFYISPNPFSDSITISTKDINLSLVTIELYDISGRKISNFTTENTNNFNFSINSNLSKGNYFLKITDQQTTQTFKLIKE